MRNKSLISRFYVTAHDRSSAKIHISNSAVNNPVDYSDGHNVKNIIVKESSIEIHAENKGSNKDLGEKAYISYTKKNGGKSIELKEELLLEDGVYRCSTNFLTKADKATYEVDFIILEDKQGNGIAEGVGNNKFEPKRNATRAEAATMIYKVLKLKGLF